MTYGFDYDSISFLHIMKKCKCELEVFDDNLERDVNTIFTGKKYGVRKCTFIVHKLIQYLPFGKSSTVMVNKSL